MSGEKKWVCVSPLLSGCWVFCIIAVNNLLVFLVICRLFLSQNITHTHTRLTLNPVYYLNHSDCTGVTAETAPYQVQTGRGNSGHNESSFWHLPMLSHQSLPSNTYTLYLFLKPYLACLICAGWYVNQTCISVGTSQGFLAHSSKGTKYI